LSEILSQSEIDNLIKELAMADQAEADDGPSDSDPNIRPYDFRTANRFPKEQMRTINIVMQNYAQLLANYFTGALRSASEIEILSIEELAFYEFNNALPSPVVLAIVNTEPLDGSIMLQGSAEISDALISRLLGGAGTNKLMKKAFTEIELAIIERVIRQMLRYFDEAWVKVLKTTSHLERIETSSQFAQIVSMNEPVAVITLSVKIGSDTGVISICLPHMALEPVTKQMNTRSWYSSAQGKK
jgi:flagellar motor switch protein FliM